MAVGKRFLESHVEFVSRVLKSESVDYCIITDKESGEETLVFTYLTPGNSRKLELGGHQLDKGPEIGRWVITEDTLKASKIEFFTFDPQPKLMGVKSTPLDRELHKQIASLKDVGISRYKGKHIFTDPLGRRWFMFDGTVPYRCDNLHDPVLFKLTCEKGIENYGGQGWMSMEHIQLYKGTWHFENADKPAILLDAVTITNQLGTMPVEDEVKKLYTIEETCDHSLATFSIALKTDGYARDVKYYKVTLHLKGLCNETQALDIAPIIKKIYEAEFRDLETIFNEGNLRIEYNEHTAMFANVVRQNVGRRYYNSMRTSELNWNRVSVRCATLSRQFA